jgi:hypothetical protein
VVRLNVFDELRLRPRGSYGLAFLKARLYSATVEGRNSIAMLSRYNFRRIYQRAVARASHDLAAIDPHGPTTCATPSRPGWKTPASPLGQSTS